MFPNYACAALFHANRRSILCLTTIRNFRHALRARNAGHSVHELKKVLFKILFQRPHDIQF